MRKITLITVLMLCLSALYSQNHGPTDTLLLKYFDNLPGAPTILSYNYTNGNGYFFGTNFIDIDQDPSTPYQDGSMACAQGFPVDSGSYYVLEILVRVGTKVKDPASSGTPLILSLHLLDDSSTYTVNTSSGSQEYTIAKPGTSLASASIAWDDMITGFGENYSVAKLNSPVLVEGDFTIVADLYDFYLNGDKIGLYASPVNGSSVYGDNYTLWLYPDPFLWVQVTHIYSNVNRAICIFPVVDDGTFGIEEDQFLKGIKLGQSYPNPAVDEANIKFEIDADSPVKIEICDAQGKLVFIDELGTKPKGEYDYKIDLTNLNSGIYYYTLFTNKGNLTKKLIVE